MSTILLPCKSNVLKNMHGVIKLNDYSNPSAILHNVYVLKYVFYFIGLIQI